MTKARKPTAANAAILRGKEARIASGFEGLPPLSSSALFRCFNAPTEGD